MVQATLLELQPEAESSARSTRHSPWIVGGWEGHRKGDRMLAHCQHPASPSKLPQMHGGQGRQEHLKASPLCFAANAGLPVQVRHYDDLDGHGVAIGPNVHPGRGWTTRKTLVAHETSAREERRNSQEAGEGRQSYTERAQNTRITNVLTTHSYESSKASGNAPSMGTKSRGETCPEVGWRAVCHASVRRVTHRRNCNQRWPEFRVNDSEANNSPRPERARGQEHVGKAGNSGRCVRCGPATPER
jgi:hypothetical protein